MKKISQSLNNNIITLVVSFLYIGVLSLCLVEFFRYKGFLGHHLFLNTYEFVAIFLIGLVAVRLWKGSLLQKWKLKRINNLIFPITLALATILFLREVYTYPNYVYAVLGVNHIALVDIILLSFFTNLITTTKNSLKKYYAMYIFFAFLIVCFTLYSYFIEFYHQLSINRGGFDDDNFMEWLQVVILGAGVIITGILAYITKKSRLLRAIYILAAIFLLILLGEEISWGERIIPYELPAIGDNRQDEFNIHNQPIINEALIILYIAAFFYAFFSWLVFKIADKKKLISRKRRELWEIFCFRGQEVFFFLPTAIINPYGDMTIAEAFPHSILSIYEHFGIVPDFLRALEFWTHWRETLEVLFYSGLVIHFLNIYLKKRKGQL